MPEHGIESTDKIIRVGSALIQTAQTRFADGFQFNDLLAFAPILMEVASAVDGAPNVWQELRDLDPPEIMQLIGYVKGATDDIRTQYIVTGVLFIFAGAVRYFPEQSSE